MMWQMSGCGVAMLGYSFRDRWRAADRACRSQVMVRPVPGDEAGQALVDGRGRGEAEIALGLGDVGIGRRHVARLHRLELDDGLAAERLLQERDEALQLLAAMIAEVVEPTGRLAAVIGG